MASLYCNREPLFAGRQPLFAERSSRRLKPRPTLGGKEGVMDADRWERKRERWERRWERRRARWNNPGKHLFSGIVFVTIGMAFLLGNMGFIDVNRVVRFWPVILIALGVFRLVECRDDYGESTAIFWIVIGGLFLLGSLGV